MRAGAWVCGSCTIGPGSSVLRLMWVPPKTGAPWSLAHSARVLTMTKKKQAPRAAVARRDAAKVLIVDDHPIVREGLTLLISGQPDLEVCGQADDVITACQVAEATSPDVVIVDL